MSGCSLPSFYSDLWACSHALLDTKVQDGVFQSAGKVFPTKPGTLYSLTAGFKTKGGQKFGLLAERGASFKGKFSATPIYTCSKSGITAGFVAEAGKSVTLEVAHADKLVENLSGKLTLKSEADDAGSKETVAAHVSFKHEYFGAQATLTAPLNWKLFAFGDYTTSDPKVNVNVASSHECGWAVGVSADLSYAESTTGEGDAAKTAKGVSYDHAQAGVTYTEDNFSVGGFVEHVSGQGKKATLGAGTCVKLDDDISIAGRVSYQADAGIDFTAAGSVACCDNGKIRARVLHKSKPGPKENGTTVSVQYSQKLDDRTSFSYGVSSDAFNLSASSQVFSFRFEA